MISGDSPRKKAPSLPVFEERVFPFWKTLLRYFRETRGLVLLAITLNMVCGLAITAQNGFFAVFSGYQVASEAENCQPGSMHMG